MTVRPMHADEVPVDAALVRRLLRDQLPHLADRPLERVTALGTDHAIFRLGDDLSVRLPRIAWARRQGERERRWLPTLAPHVPVAVPVPVAVGEPAHGYPFAWYVAPWLAGGRPALDGTEDLDRLALDLAAFVAALQSVGTDGAPAPAPGRRGGPLGPADDATRAAAEQLRGATDVDGLLAAWEAGLRAPAWAGAPVWAHGDLSDGNLVVRDGRLAGVIDWGGLVAGDPAVDLLPAWHLFDVGSRQTYRDALPWADEAAWLRGRAWATSQAVQALPYYRETNPDIVTRSWRAVDAVLADLGAR